MSLVASSPSVTLLSKWSFGEQGSNPKRRRLPDYTVGITATYAMHLLGFFVLKLGFGSIDIGQVEDPWVLIVYLNQSQGEMYISLDRTIGAHPVGA